MSAQNTFMTAIRASERGAYEYLPKPFDLKELIAIVGRALSEPKERARPPAKAEDFESIPLVGRSPAMQEIYRVLARLMQTDLTVMISGESGTGKELVARALHDYGKRRTGPFVAINMAAIPRDLIESELFGHEKGAFTGANTRSAGRFEQAEGGTLFLDEIGDMPMEAQTRLLRVLQQGEYTTVGGRTPIKADVRIIAATNKDLRQLIQQGLFREDLFFRLNVVPLRLPPLRERTEDIPDLIRHFFALVEREGLPPKQIDQAALERLKPASLARQCARTGKSGAPARRALSAGDDHRRGDRRRTVAAGARSRRARVSRGDDNLSSAVERYLAQYFSGFDDGLPPPGLYHRILREVEAPLLVGAHWRRPAATRSAPPTCLASTATRCARKSATWKSRSIAPAAAMQRLAALGRGDLPRRKVDAPRNCRNRATLLYKSITGANGPGLHSFCAAQVPCLQGVHDDCRSGRPARPGRGRHAGRRSIPRSAPMPVASRLIGAIAVGVALLVGDRHLPGAGRPDADRAGPRGRRQAACSAMLADRAAAARHHRPRSLGGGAGAPARLRRLAAACADRRPVRGHRRGADRAGRGGRQRRRSIAASTASSRPAPAP